MTATDAIFTNLVLARHFVENSYIKLHEIPINGLVVEAKSRTGGQAGGCMWSTHRGVIFCCVKMPKMRKHSMESLVNKHVRPPHRHPSNEVQKLPKKLLLSHASHPGLNTMYDCTYKSTFRSNVLFPSSG